MDAFIKKFASDVATVVDSCVDLINRQDDMIKKLKSMPKQASADSAAVSAAEADAGLDADKLQKAASALHTMHGNPANCTPDQIAQYWKANPSSMLTLIEKMANAAIEKASAPADFGKLVEKRASADDKASTKRTADKASEAFWSSL